MKSPVQVLIENLMLFGGNPNLKRVTTGSDLSIQKYLGLHAATIIKNEKDGWINAESARTICDRLNITMYELTVMMLEEEELRTKQYLIYQRIEKEVIRLNNIEEMDKAAKIKKGYL